LTGIDCCDEVESALDSSDSVPKADYLGTVSMRRGLPVLATLALASWLTFAGDGPAVPYLDWGACPFECCTYREWVATGKLKLHKDRSLSTPVAFSLSKGERVQGLTGVVITLKPGRVKILKPITLDDKKPVSLAPGDVIYTLHYLGEGYDLFWFKGQVHSDQITADKIEREPNPEAYWQVLALPEAEWWVKIKNAEGKIGWTNETDKFDNMDACG